MKYFYTILILFVVKFGYSQFGGYSYKQISELKKQGLTVLLADDECKNKSCEEMIDWNKALQKAFTNNFDFCNIKFVKLSKDNKKKYKDTEEAFYLDYISKSVEKEKAQIGAVKLVEVWYKNYWYVMNRKYKNRGDKKNLVAGYSFGLSGWEYPDEYHDYFPMAVKLLNQFLHDAEKYKTHKLQLIASNNSKKQKLDQVYIFRGHALVYRKKEEKLRELFNGVNIKFVGIKEIKELIFSNTVTNKAIIFPNQAWGDEKGVYYYIIQGSTGKVLDVVEIKGLTFKFFNKKDVEEISERIKRKYS